MIVLLSPAKNLDFKTPSPSGITSKAGFQDETLRLVSALRRLSAKQMEKLMGIAPKLATLNVERYRYRAPEYTPENSKQAVFAFNGEVYYGLKAGELSDDDLLFAQEHLRILSGLHGILKPMDLIQPYRLEMGSPLKIGKFKNLYEFWGEKIFREVNEALKTHKVLVNLASNEYSRAVMVPKLKGEVIIPEFRELKGDMYRTVLTYTKRARGLMARYIIDKRITEAEKLKQFDMAGYSYNESLSRGNAWVFTR